MIVAEAKPCPSQGWGPEALEEILKSRREFQDRVASRRGEWIRANRYFDKRLERALQFIVEPSSRVLDVRCETGQLLASLKPVYGVAGEISANMVAAARLQHPDLHFVQSEPEDLDLPETYDYVLFNHIFDTVDVLRAFQRIRQHCAPGAKFVEVAVLGVRVNSDGRIQFCKCRLIFFVLQNPEVIVRLC